MRDFLTRLRRAATPIRPNALIRSQAPDELRARRDRWEALPYYPKAQHPPGTDEGEVAGVDLALLAGDVAAIFWEYFETGRNTEFEVMKELSVEDLRRAVPSLSGPAHTYFGEALDILEAIIARSESANGSAALATAPEPSRDIDRR